MLSANDNFSQAKAYEQHAPCEKVEEKNRLSEQFDTNLDNHKSWII